MGIIKLLIKIPLKAAKLAVKGAYRATKYTAVGLVDRAVLEPYRIYKSYHPKGYDPRNYLRQDLQDARDRARDKNKGLDEVVTVMLVLLSSFVTLFFLKTKVTGAAIGATGEYSIIGILAFLGLILAVRFAK